MKILFVSLLMLMVCMTGGTFAFDEDDEDDDTPSDYDGTNYVLIDSKYSVSQIVDDFDGIVINTGTWSRPFSKGLLSSLIIRETTSKSGHSSYILEADFISSQWTKPKDFNPKGPLVFLAKNSDGVEKRIDLKFLSTQRESRTEYFILEPVNFEVHVTRFEITESDLAVLSKAKSPIRFKANGSPSFYTGKLKKAEFFKLAYHHLVLDWIPNKKSGRIDHLKKPD